MPVLDPAKIAEVNRLLREQQELLTANAETAAELLLTLRSVAEQTVKGTEGIAAMIAGFEVLADHATPYAGLKRPVEPSLN